MVTSLLTVTKSCGIQHDIVNNRTFITPGQKESIAHTYTFSCGQELGLWGQYLALGNYLWGLAPYLGKRSLENWWFFVFVFPFHCIADLFNHLIHRIKLEIQEENIYSLLLPYGKQEVAWESPIPSHLLNLTAHLALL